MIRMDLQLFAHKKGVGSSRNGRDSNPKMLGVRDMVDSWFQQEVFWSDNGEPI